jgi:hypothetical protein
MIKAKFVLDNIIEKNFIKYDTSISTNEKKQEIRFNKSHHHTFTKKTEALSYIEKNGNNLKLFAEDICEDNGSKKFIVSSYDNIYYLSKDKKHHLYESYEANQKLKLILDIDIKIENKDNNRDEYTDIEPIIIVLKSCRSDKNNTYINFTHILLSMLTDNFLTDILADCICPI